jgi:hypothetical protein
MVGTHADSLIAEALVKNITGFNQSLAYEAAYKDATVPPANDSTVVYVPSPLLLPRNLRLQQLL